MRRQALDRLAVVAAALLFSTGAAAIKWTELSGVQLACARSGLAAILLFGALPRWRPFWEPRALLVGVPYATTMVLFVLASKLTTAANAIFLQYTAPVYVLLLSPWLLKEPVRLRDVGTTAVVLAGGVLCFVGTETPLSTAPHPGSGNAIAIGAGLSWALTLLGLRWLASQPGRGRTEAASSGPAIVAGNGIAFAACLPFLGELPIPSGKDLAVLAWLGVAQLGLAYLLLDRGLRGTPALEVSLLLLLEPLLGTGIAWLLHDEIPGGLALAGCGLILAATATQSLQAIGEARSAERRSARSDPPRS